MKENIEKIFRDDIREKKRTGSGSFHMRGKGVKHGFSGALRTPYHFMKQKEKNKLNGEVKVSNLYETVISKSEFDLKDQETKKLLMTRWRELYSNAKIMHEMGIRGNATFSKMCENLGLPKKRAGVGRKPKSKNVAIAKVDPKQTLLEFAVEPEPVQEQPKAILITKGLHLEYNGEYSADELAKIFTKMQLLVDGEPNKFKISLAITECDN